MAVWPPPLLAERSRTVQVVLVLVVPALFGALCGFLLGAAGTAYQVVVAVGVIGALGAGFEHAGARSGLLRGLAAGVVFAVSLIAVHEAIGTDADVDLKPSLGVVALVYALISAGFGALGGWLRGRRAVAPGPGA